MTSPTRRLAVTFVAALLALAPVACSSDDDGDASPSTSTVAGTSTTAAPNDEDTPDGPGTEDTEPGDVTVTTAAPNGSATTLPSGRSVESFCATLEAVGSQPVDTPAQFADAIEQLQEVAPPEVSDTLTELSEILRGADSLEELEGHPRAGELNEIMGSYTDANCESE